MSANFGWSASCLHQDPTLKDTVSMESSLYRHNILVHWQWLFRIMWYEVSFFLFLMLLCQLANFLHLLIREGIKLWKSSPCWILQVYSLSISQMVLQKGRLCGLPDILGWWSPCSHPIRVGLLSPRVGPTECLLRLTSLVSSVSYSLQITSGKVEFHCFLSTC